jgi:hypothetical protein
MTKSYRRLYTFLSKKWRFDQLSNGIFVLPLMTFGYKVSFQLLDKGNIECYGPLGLSSGFNTLSNFTSWFHSGYTFHYLFIMVLSLFSIVLISLCSFFFWNNLFFGLLLLTYFLGISLFEKR